jgi:GT2 family glycosyltransferase
VSESPPRVSIVTVTFDAAAFVGPFLEALARLTYPDLEIVVVDNASRDETVALVRRALPTAIVVEPGRNLGFPAGSNLGAARASGEVLLFLNPDTRPPADAVERLADAVWTRHEIGAAGCRLVFPDGRIESAGGTLGRDGQGWNRGWGERDTGAYAAEADVDYVTGAALAIRRALFAEVGGFHEGYFPGFYEDAELGIRLRQLGYRSVYLPEPTIVHLEGQSMGRRRAYWLHRNRILFLMRTRYAGRPGRGVAREAAWLWREHGRPLSAALLGAHPWKLRAEWARLRPALAGELVGGTRALLGGREWHATARRSRLARGTSLALRRLWWVTKDAGRVGGGALRLPAHARRASPTLALGLLEGEPHARRGRANRYRVRVVNDADAPTRAALRLHGERESGEPLEVAASLELAAGSAQEVFLVTDWEARFEIVSAAPTGDGLDLIDAPAGVERCRIVAALADGGREVARLAITQPLGS